MGWPQVRTIRAEKQIRYLEVLHRPRNHFIVRGHSGERCTQLGRERGLLTTFRVLLFRLVPFTITAALVVSIILSYLYASEVKF